MAAVMSADMAQTDKVVTLIRDCRDSCGLDVKPPDINMSRFEFTVDDDKTIRYGLGAVRGVGQGVVEAIIAEREAARPVHEHREPVPAAGSVEAESARARSARFARAASIRSAATAPR